MNICPHSVQLCLAHLHTLQRYITSTTNTCVFSMLVWRIHASYHHALPHLCTVNCDKRCNLHDILVICNMLIWSDLQGKGNDLELLPSKCHTFLWVG
jgi:hypothetical protein